MGSATFRQHLFTPGGGGKEKYADATRHIVKAPRQAVGRAKRSQRKREGGRKRHVGVTAAPKSVRSSFLFRLRSCGTGGNGKMLGHLT